MPTALLEHAREALEHAGQSLAQLHSSLPGPAAALGRRHRQLIDEALQELWQRHESLQARYEAMTGAAQEELPDRWREFFAAYDAYLANLRDTRRRLFQDEDGGDGPAPGT